MSNRCRIRWQIRAFKNEGPNARMRIERSTRRAQNFIFNCVQINLSIRFGEHPVPFGTLLQAYDVQAIRACDANRLQVLRTKSTRVGCDDADFAFRAVDLPYKGDLQETGRKYRHAHSPGQFPLEDGIESTTRGYCLDSLRHHRPGIGNHCAQNSLIWLFKNGADVGTRHAMESDSVFIRCWICAITKQGLKLHQALG